MSYNKTEGSNLYKYADQNNSQNTNNTYYIHNTMMSTTREQFRTHVSIKEMMYVYHESVKAFNYRYLSHWEYL